MTDKEAIKSKDVANMLGVSINTVRLWREKERGPKYFMRGYGRYFYKYDDVIQFAKDKGYDVKE